MFESLFPLRLKVAIVLRGACPKNLWTMDFHKQMWSKQYIIQGGKFANLYIVCNQ